MDGLSYGENILDLMWPLKGKGQVQTPKSRWSYDKIIHLDFGRKTANIIIKNKIVYQEL